jgi:diguanylate cyclase (GGDEF)-like protein
MIHLHRPGEDDKLQELLESAQYQRLARGFETATGLTLHAYSVVAIPHTQPFDPPHFCQSLQSGLDCPLYFDPRYHVAVAPEIRATCAGLGHAVVPVLDADGKQVLNLVSAPARLGPVDMEQLSDLAFRLKIFPDDLATQADQVPLVPHDRLMLASQLLFAGAHELFSEDTGRASSVELLTRHVAAADADDVPTAIVAAALEFSGAEFGLVELVDDDHNRLASGCSIEGDDWRPRVAAGLAQWVIHAGDGVEIADLASSAWSRHLAGDEPPHGTMVGVPINVGERLIGGLVVGAEEGHDPHEWSARLQMFAEAGADALLLARRLVQTGGGVLVDGASGAYNLRFLEELLEKEISRAGRYRHELSLVFFHTLNYSELVQQLGERGVRELLGQMVRLMRSKTRKINSLARVSDADFCLVVPEADRGVAERIAGELRAVAQAEPFRVKLADGHAEINLALQTRTLTNPRGVDGVLEVLNALN